MTLPAVGQAKRSPHEARAEAGLVARAGPVDGPLGPTPPAAVRRFQRRPSLAGDGLVANATRGALVRTRLAELAPEVNLGASGGGLAGRDRVLVLGAAGALLLAGALALALGRPGRRHAAGAPVNYESVTGDSPPRALELQAVASPPKLIQIRSPAGRPDVAKPAAPTPGGPGDGPMLGYVPISVAQRNRNGNGVSEQLRIIASECEWRGLTLLEVVHDWELHDEGLERPGLESALKRISEGEARGLVVSELSRLSRSVGQLGVIIEWFTRSNARLIAVAEQVDTYESGGWLASRALIEVSRWEREPHIERTEGGHQASSTKRRRAVADDPRLVRRIKQMRSEKMSLQAIADRLNADGVPTVRGGVKWRPSSVHAAVGYKRPPRRPTEPAGRRGPVPREQR